VTSDRHLLPDSPFKAAHTGYINNFHNTVTNNIITFIQKEKKTQKHNRKKKNQIKSYYRIVRQQIGKLAAKYTHAHATQRMHNAPTVIYIYF
jgi:hypothetical protein